MSPSHAKSRPASRSTSPGKPAGKPAGKPTRAQKREAKKQRKATKGPGFLGQIKQVFKMTREVEPNIGWWMLLIGLGVLLVFLLIGALLGNWITGLLIGLPFALLAASFYLSRRAERAAESLSVQLVLPLGLCSLPAFVCWGVLPVVMGLVPEVFG